ncbi:MAG: NAD(P)/FAD-dependent oxidoreductase [Hyphomicrobiaceae bacterium]
MAAYDLLVVGGGVQGLWVARAAIAAGLRVAVVEAEHCGAGASGGVLGALMPHVPTGWSEKKQFQLLALADLEHQAGRLAEETGLDTGYARCGRVMPIRAKGFLDQFESRRAASWRHWRTALHRYELDLLASDALADWLAPEAAQLGIFWDPLAARIDPERYIAALKAALQPHCDIFEGAAFADYDVETRRVACAGGHPDLIADRIVLAAGYQTFALVERLTDLAMGAGVKGQAVVLAAELPAQRPIIYDDGMYIVAHTDNLCAIGSTTEPDWTDARSVDDALAAKLEHARRICPPLRDAPVVASWAGVRPQSAARDPIVGQLLPDSPIYIASGGFKITLGIAHTAAHELVDGIVHGRAPSRLPASFAPAVHVAAARARTAGQNTER